MTKLETRPQTRTGLTLPGWVTLNEQLNLSEPQVPNGKNGDDNETPHMRFRVLMRRQ